MNFLIRTAAIAAMLHITPIVVLVKRSDAVQALLPGADAYVAREVHLSGTDAHRLQETVDWSPADGVLVCYGGTEGSTSGGAAPPRGRRGGGGGCGRGGAVGGPSARRGPRRGRRWGPGPVAAGPPAHRGGLGRGGARGGARGGVRGGAAGIAGRAGN